MGAKNLYVAGFLFCDDQVLLVRKSKPRWQEGLLNAVGGKIESGETPYHAMCREFEEEVGYLHRGWREFAVEHGRDYVTYFFKLRIAAAPRTPLSNDAGESLHWVVPIQAQSDKVIGNLRWLMPLAMDWRDCSVTCIAPCDIVDRPSW
jgi:8-oxo-dGTP pyrophosphatase MutT (NUDIX family)